MTHDRKRFIIYCGISTLFALAIALAIGGLISLVWPSVGTIVFGAVFIYVLIELIGRYRKMVRQFRI